MITAISTIKTTIKTTIKAHITITRLATRGALLALFAGLFILAACGGGGGGGSNVVAPGGGPACTNPFAEGCGDAGAGARAAAITACRLLIEKNQTCADTIPDAVITCLTDPYNKETCVESAYEAAIRTTSATVLIGALQDGRTDSCRGRTVAGARLCDGAIDNTCLPLSTIETAARNGLVLDNLCNNAPNYIDARTDFVADCTDTDLLNDDGCTTPITTCTNSPFGTTCGVDVYDSYRAVECRDAAEGTANARCDSENIIATYCTANAFVATAGCLADEDFAGARIADCVIGDNVRQPRCKNETIFATSGLIACFENPYGTGCEALLDGSFNNAQSNRENYCTGLGMLAGGNMLCDAAILNVCTGDDADIFDPLCFADNYQTLRETACRATDSEDASRCTATVAQICTDNPFTQTVGGTAGDLCTDADARVAFVARCASGEQTGCDAVSVGAVQLSVCVDDPYDARCDDAVFEDIKTARYNHCISDTASLNCAGVESFVCVSDAESANPLANPFLALCRVSAADYGAVQTAFCMARAGENLPECEPTFIDTCNGDPFATVCVGSDSYASDRAVIITACLADMANDVSGLPNCSGMVGDTGTTTVGDCAANPFDAANGCSTNAGFDATRVARTTLCAASATPFDSLCDNFDRIESARTTHCTNDETFFNALCLDDDKYPNTRTLRESFCTQTANRFLEQCTNVDGVRDARETLALACSANPEAAGCDQFANGISGATLADCVANPFNTANGCDQRDSFDPVRDNRTTLCQTRGEGHSPYDPLCDNFTGIVGFRTAYCTSINADDGGSFDANCALDYPDGTALARRAFALLCRTSPAPAACATTIVAKDVSVADCIDNPYQRECYGTANNRNPDFAAEVAARDELCKDGGDIYSSLCLNSAGMEIIAGVEAARVAGCTTPAVAAFNDACTETAYVGTNAARRGYCSTRATGSSLDTRRCGTYEASICGADADANPFAAICPDNSVNQMAFCNLDKNAIGASNPAAQCTNDPVRVCPIEPFNETAGIDGMVNCKDNVTIPVVNARATRCAAGTEGVGSDCNDLGIVTRVCVADGSRANPFAEFCETADGVPGDLNAAKTAFADACASANASVHCETSDVTDALCASSGDFIRPFASTCSGAAGARSARVSFCGKGDNVTEEIRCNDNEIIASVCRDDPFSSGCETTGESYIAELRDLRAAHCESLTDSDALCSADAVTAVCEGYTGVSGEVVINPLANLCMGGYVTERRDACLNIASEINKNAVCDTISAVTEMCRPNPFDATTPGCAFISEADNLREAYCVAPETTWQGVCNTLAVASGGDNTVDTARRDSCLDLHTNRRSAEACKALESVGDECEASPFEHDGCNVFAGATLEGYELAYCETAATAWDVECDGLVAAGGNDVDDMRGSACEDATQADDEMAAGYFSPRCNMRSSFRLSCMPNPFADATPGCAFHEDFETLATNYCKDTATAWMEGCDMRAEAAGGDNDIFRARRTACLASASADVFPDTDCAMVTIDYCGDTENSANAFDSGCDKAVYTGTDTTLVKQRQKACAEGGSSANALCTDKSLALEYCMDDPFAGLGCDELDTIATIRSGYCTTTNPGAEGCDVTVACMRNPFDGRCVDTSGSDYADARKARANACALPSPAVDLDCTRVNACNARPFSATTAHIPTGGTATTCSSDPAFADIRATLIAKCIVVNAVQPNTDCQLAVDDGVSCLANPYEGDVLCAGDTQLGDANNVATAKASFCRTTTGSNSFDPNCNGENADIKEARVDSCLHAGVPTDIHSTCPTLITGFCTDTTGGADATAFDARCDASEGNHRTGTATARVTLCVNGTTHENCPTIGDSFTAWTDGDAADTGADILDAGAGTTTANANFIKGVLNADGNLHLGKNPLDENIMATTRVIRLNHDYTGDEASATPLSGDAEDGFVYATADVAADGASRFYVGILHTTDLGAPITNTTGKALWKGVIQAYRYDGTNSYIHNADFVLEVNFATTAIDFHVDTSGVITNVVTLLGQDGVKISITTGSFNRTTGLITGTVLLADNAMDSTKTTTALLRGVIGEDGAVGVFASESPNTGDFGDFVGGFVASARDDIPVCNTLATDPFGRGCGRDVEEVLDAQYLACTTGVLPNNNPVTAADCNHALLSYLICGNETHSNSPSDPFAQICTDAAITMKLAADTIAARATIRAYCEPLANAGERVCMAREAQLARLDSVCVVGDAPVLFGARCKDYAEFIPERAEVCRKRDALSTLTCDTAEIMALVCTTAGVAANPFDTICSPTTGTYAGARKTFATRCAVQRANDSRGQRVLKGADCSDSGLNSDCLDDPFTTVGGCNADANYDKVREDRISICRELSDINLFDYNCFGAIENVCGLTSAPTDAVLFKDSLCVNETDYDTRRAAIVEDCVAADDPTNENCEFEAVAAVTRTVIMMDNNGVITGTTQEEVSPAKTVGECIASPYDVKCLHDAFDDTRTAVLGGCDIATFVSMSTTGVDCLEVQTSVCGGGIYAKNPFAAFCEKKDVTDMDNPLTIASVDLADGRNKYCQIGTNATSVTGCAEFLARPTTAALLATAANSALVESPNTTAPRNQFLRGTADGLNTGGFIRKNGQFVFVSTLNLSTATHSTRALGGDAADGVAYFAGRQHITQGDITTDVNYYAGIHSGTDLGNPLPRQYGTAGEDVTVDWNGRIGWLVYDENNAADGYAFDGSDGRNGVMDFALTINLTKRTLYAHIARMAVLSGARGFLLEGVYDRNGVISGTAKYGPNGGTDLSSALYNGFLIGLIGAEGAVGAFHLTGSGQEAMQGASGGFVVSSALSANSDQIAPDKGTFNYWIANRKDADGGLIDVLETGDEINGNNPAVNFIVAGSGTGLGSNASGGEQKVLKFSSASSDGFGYGFATVGGVEKFYVGLLASTALGAPITGEMDATVGWRGLLAIAKQDNQGTATSSYLTTQFGADFSLTITFAGSGGGGTIKTSDFNGTRIVLSRSIYDTAGIGDQFVIDGTFDQYGLISGTTTYIAINGGSLIRHGGILTGLIGAEGAAGIFTSKASGANLNTVGHYVGGFVASRSLGLGGADTWADNALMADGTTKLEVKDVNSAVQGDDEYTFIRGGDTTLNLGSEARKSDDLTQDLTFGTDLILDDGDVFSLNSTAVGGISFAQAEVGADTQFYAGLLSNTFVGTPLTADASVDWRGVISIIAGATPTLYTTNFRLAINFSTKTVFSTTDFLRTADDVIHNIELSGKFSDTGVIYGTATYQVGSERNEGELTGLIGIRGAAAVFGGGDTDSDNDAGRFVGGIVAVPGGITSALIPHSTFVWAAGIDEAVFEDTRFDKNVAEVSADGNTITVREENDEGVFVETVIADTGAINLDTTVLGGRNNADRTEDGFVVFKAPASDTRRVGIVAGTNLGGPVVDIGRTGLWHARMAGFLDSTEFNTNFTLNVDFDNKTLGVAADKPRFQVTVGMDTATFDFTFANIGWNPSTGFFTGPITLGTTVDATTRAGVLRGIIGADGAVATFKVAEAEGATSTRAFIGGFVAVPESIGVKRGQTAYWAQYARNADDTAGLDVRGVRGAKADDRTYTVIEGGYETLELGLEVAKNTDPDLTYDLTFRNTEVFADGSTFNIDSTVSGGVSFYATETSFTGNYYAGLLSGTDVGRTLTAAPTANWVGRLAVIYGTTNFDNTPYTEDFELAIDFDARTLKSFLASGTAGEAHAITFLEAGGLSYEAIIDGKFNDRGIIYGTTTIQANSGSALSNVSAGTLTGLIGEKGAAAVFYSSEAGIGVGVYAGGFIAVPNRGDLTQVYDNIPASYNSWVVGADTTTQKVGSATATSANTAAFTTEVPAEADQTTPFSLNLAPLGGGVGNGFIGYGAVNARHIGLLSSVSLGGVNLNTGTATWTGVMRLIIGNGGTDGVLTQSFTLNVAFDDETIGLAGEFAFTRDTVAYDLTFAQLGWDEDSGLITGTVNIIPTANTGQVSVGDVRGLIGADGLVAAFRSTAASHSSFTGGFVATEIKRTETPFADYFSSEAGGELLKATANGTVAKFARTSDTKLLFNGGTLFATGFYRLGAGALNAGSNPNGFVFAFGGGTADWAVGLLNTTDLGAPLPLIYAGAALEWTGTLYVQSNGNPLFPITLLVNLADGTIKTKEAVTGFYANSITVDGYFGLNPLAIAAKLPLGFLAGKAVYIEGSTPNDLDLIGQIGQTGVVGIFSGAVGANGKVVGGFAAFSSGVTANAREFNINLPINLTRGIVDIGQTGHEFLYADVNGNIKDASTSYRFGLGGVDNTPSATNPNGFTLAWSELGFAAAAGIWANTNLGPLLPTTASSAIWTGTVQTLKVSVWPNRRLAGAAIQSAFTIQVDFENSTISTVASIDDQTDVVTLGAIDLTGGDTIEFMNAGFDATGTIGCSNPCRVDYTVSGVSDQTFGLSLTGLIGPKGAIGLFRGALSNDVNAGTRREAPGIIGGFQVIPTARVTKVAPPPRVVVIPPKQLNYAAYLKYYVTDYTATATRPAVNVGEPVSEESQFRQSLTDGTSLDTGSNTVHHANADSFNPFTVYLNGADASTRNGFTLIGASFAANALSGYRNYAGLLAGADVGRFTDALTGTAEWSGNFYSSAYVSGTDVGNRVPVRFPLTLTVNFELGEIGTNGVLELLDGHSVNIAGTFGFTKGDANQGIIAGEVFYTAPNTIERRQITRAPLYGIIGDAGALAVFASGGYGADGTGGESPLVGGFEVSPNPVPTVHYQIFEDYFSGLDVPDERRIYSKIGEYSTLLKGTATGLLQDFISPAEFDFYVQRPDQTHAECSTTRNCNILTSRVVRLGEDERSNSGFVIMTQYSQNFPSGDIYAGLLTGTNLGAVLPVRFASGNTTAVWHGSIYNSEESIEISTGVEILIHQPLSLTLDLAAGTLRTVNLLGNLGSVALSATNSVTIDGRFGLNPETAKLPYGILTGTVRYNGEPYKLAGLIGVDGAIGVFARVTGATPGTPDVNGNMPHGGFEVSPPPPPAYGRAEYAVFEDFYIKRPEADDRYLEASRTADTAQFVRGLRIGLVAPADGDLVADAGNFAPLAVYLGGDADSGNAFIIENFNGTYVAGLLGTTDLGFAPHESLASATWEGTFYVSNNVESTGTAAPAPFEIKSGVEVDFGAGTLTSTQETYTLANGEFISFGIFGEFGRINELPLGILAGVVKYGHHATDADLIVTADLRDLPLIGVIGRQGALGIFRDPSDNNLVGGFQVADSVSYRVWRDARSRAQIQAGFRTTLSRHTSSITAIDRAVLLRPNDAGTGLVAVAKKYGTPPNANQNGALITTDEDIAGFADGTRYGLGDDSASLNGFILAGASISPIAFDNTQNPLPEIRIVGVGFLETANVGAVILDVIGSATWAGKGYVVDTVDDTTKVFTLNFKLDFAAGTFNTIGGTNGTITADGVDNTQTLKIAGIFGQGTVNQSGGYLTSGQVTYNNGGAVDTNSLYGLIGRGGAIGVFYGGGAGGATGYAGGFWASPSAGATTVNYAAFKSHYDAVITDVNTISFLAEPDTSVRFADTSPADSAMTGLQGKSFFELGKGTGSASVTDGLFAYVYSNVKVIGITTTTDLGAVLPNTTASATWLGRLFVKSDATAFNAENEKQIGLDVDFSEGTIDTKAPVEFGIGAQTHSVSIRGRFGLHSFARGSNVPSATGLLSGFVTYTHHGQKAANFELIGLIGAEGALGIFKGNIPGFGVVGGFEASPDTTATYMPNHATYLKQFKGYINDTPQGENVRSQISLGEAQKLVAGGTPDYRPTFRLGGNDSNNNLDTTDTDVVDGFAMVAWTNNMHKSVGILLGTDLGMPVTSNTELAIWSGRLVVNPAFAVADAVNSVLNLQVNFAAGTIETLQPISIVAYAAVDGGTPSVRKQTLEIKGRFGSHAQASGLRTGTLGGSIIYRVGHLTPTQAAALTSSTEVTKHSVTIAHLPLRGLIGAEGAIGVFHGSVGSDVHIIGGFEVSPRAEITTTTASFERWAQGATECGTINRTITTINLPNECALGAHTPIVFAHPNDLFESDDDLRAGRRPTSKGFVLGSNKETGIDFSSALSPIPADVAIRILTLGGDNFDNGTFVAGNTFFTNTSKRFSLGGDDIGTDADGIAFVTHYGNGTTFYAGLLSTTDLGAPLGASLDGDVTAKWPGRFAFESYNTVYQTNDFVLDINLTAKTISTARVNARRPRPNGGYSGDFTWTLQGRYDDSGIITGIIKDTDVAVTRIGTLTGLIGVEGAVGAFLIDETNLGGGTNSFVGGFVAAPVGTIQATSYEHFSTYHGALTDQRKLNADLTTGGDASLLAGTDDGLGLNITVGSTATFSMTGGTGGFQKTYYLGGASSGDDGFVVLRGTLTDTVTPALDGVKYRAGILSGADLGLVVSAEVNGLWTGTAYVIHNYQSATSKTEPFATVPLNFEVDFTAGTFRTVSDKEGFVEVADVGVEHIFRVRGLFGGDDLPPGILGGTVTYALAADGTDSSTLELSGLIGADGAIGVFARTDGSLRFAGGFTARPFALTDVGTATPPTAVNINQLHADHLTKGRITSGGFVRLGSTFTNDDVATFAPTGSASNDTTVTLRSDVDFTGGVAYFALTDSDGGGDFFYYHAGILANTALGTPLSISDAPKVATWTGRFSEHLTRESTDKDNFVKFHIDYEAGTLQFSNAGQDGAGTLVRDGNTYTLNGVFGHGIIDANNNVITTGQLGGRVLRSDSKTAVLSGLIGAQGVVGAFVDTADGSHFAGGFWAVPELRVEVDKNTGEVNFSDWSRSFNRETPLTATLRNDGKDQFLPGLETETADGKRFLNEPALTSIATVHHQAGLLRSTRVRFALTFDADGATHGGKPLGGAGTAADGVAGFWGNGLYAGILSGTNLGAPITADHHGGAWRGQFVAYRQASSNSGVFATKTDFILNVGYGDGPNGRNTLTMNQSCVVGGKSCINDNQGGLSSFGANNYYEMVGGTFDDSGVISGTINFYYRTSSTNYRVPGILTGLIGRDGAVGTFIGGKGTIGSIELNDRRLNPSTGEPLGNGTGARFFGGFVATSQPIRGTVAVTTMANHANFDYYYTNYGGGDRRISATFAASGAAVKAAFLEGTTTGFANTTGLTGLTPTVVKLGEDTTSDNGFIFATGYVDATTLPVNARFRVGLLTDTDLGAAFVSTPASVLSWKGSIHMLTSEGTVRTTDSTFTLDFTDGTISTDALAIGTNDMIRIAGTFRYGAGINPRLDTGILGGSAFFTDTSSTTTTELPLIGLIGANGAIGIFHADTLGVGGFQAAPPPPRPCETASNCVNHALWLSNALDADGTGTTLRTAIKTEANKTNDTADAHFIAGGADTEALKNFTYATAPTEAKLTLSLLEGSDDANSGFSAVRVRSDSVYIYAGLLSDTDVGAPFTSTSLPAAKWTAILQSSNSAASLPFILDVAFTGGAGTIKTKAGGFNYLSNANLKINGQFDSNGVIYGTVTIADDGNFTYGDGSLSGLIGVNGAVGVFAGLTPSPGLIPFGGGFVASPRPVSVAGTVPWWIDNAIDGRDLAKPRNLGVRAAGDVTRNDARFSFATADTTRVALGTALPFHVRNVESTLKLTDTNIGFAFAFAFFDPPSSVARYYAGILDGTDVGAPFTSGNLPAAEWTGSVELHAGDSRNYTDTNKKAITLDVVFDGTDGVIKTKPGGVNFAIKQDLIIDGKFGANGVIYGTTDFRYPTIGDVALSNVGALSGLIGVNGAVGVFGGSTGGYAGGFVALPNPSACEIAGNCVNYADWKKDATLTTIVGSEPPTVNAFVSTTGDKLDTAGIPGSPTSVNLSTAQFGGADLGGDASDGFSYFTAGGNMFVGIHETTNLGGPVTEAIANMTWNGSFVSVEVSGFVGTPTTTPFALDVVFGSSNPGKSGSVSNMGDIGETGYSFTGEFDANGVITATTAHGANGAGTMRGLIGAEGAVGVFYSNPDANNVYGGGFVARPTP